MVAVLWYTLLLSIIKDILTYTLVYGATWAGETYYRQSSEAQKELQNSTDVVGDIARKGSLALVLFSFISFAGSVMLPWVVESPDSEDDPLTPAKEVPEAVGWAMNLVRRYRLDITTAWGISQLGFATSMILAPFSSSFQFATTLIALCGLYVLSSSLSSSPPPHPIH